MNGFATIAVDLGIIVLFMAGIWRFTTPKGARAGNLTAAFALAAAMALVLYRHGTINAAALMLSILAGGAAGILLSMRVSMIQIPAMVAFQHGAGGIAAFLISAIELSRAVPPLGPVAKVSGILGLVIGAATFSASMVASGKLANRISQVPAVLPLHGILLGLLATAVSALGIAAFTAPHAMIVAICATLILLSVLLGIAFSIRIGGADMPVLISFLNATAGLAAAFCGIVMQNRLLIACGATVTASGSILTIMMCRAMNRGIFSIFRGIQYQKKNEADTTGMQTEPVPAEENVVRQKARHDYLAAIGASQRIIVVPGYGMAMAQAQGEVKALYDLLTGLGKEVKFAIHPVAGRMPGHMNVLLAEVDIPYDRLVEMQDINGEFPDTGVTIIVGACDVVNPAAMTAEGTPLYGMPILRADLSALVLVFNLDERPGYSGVPNPLYGMDNVVFIAGSAAETLASLIGELKESTRN